MKTPSSILAWKIPWTEEPGVLQTMESQSWTWLNTCTHVPLILPIFLLWFIFLHLISYFLSFPGGSYGKESACNEGDLVSVPGSGRSSGEGNGNSLQYSWRILGEFHGERESLADYNPWGHKELDTTKQLTTIVVVQSPSRLQLFTTPWTAVRQASLFLIISQSLPKFMFIALVMLSSHLILWHPLLLLPSIFPSIRDFPSCLFTSNDQNTRASASVFPVNIQDWSPYCPRDFQESSPAPQFKGIHSLSLCLLYSPPLSTVCDHWEENSLNYMDLCQYYLCFSTPCLDLSSFSCQEVVVFWFHGCSHHKQWF